MSSPVWKLIAELKAVSTAGAEKDGPEAWAKRVAGKLESIQELDEELSAVPAPLIRSLGRTFRQVTGQLREGLAERLRRSWEPAVHAALEDEEDDNHKSTLLKMLGVGEGESPVPEEAAVAAKKMTAKKTVPPPTAVPQPTPVPTAGTSRGAPPVATGLLPKTAGSAAGGAAESGAAGSWRRPRDRPFATMKTFSKPVKRAREGEAEESEKEHRLAKKAKAGKGKERAIDVDADEDEEESEREEGSEEGSDGEDGGEVQEDEEDELASAPPPAAAVNAAAEAKKAAEQARLAEYKRPQPSDQVYRLGHMCETCIARGFKECRVAFGESKCRSCRGSKKKCSGPVVGVASSSRARDAARAASAAAKKLAAAPTPTAGPIRPTKKAAPKSRAVLSDTEDEAVAVPVVKPTPKPTPKPVAKAAPKPKVVTPPPVVVPRVEAAPPAAPPPVVAAATRVPAAEVQVAAPPIDAAPATGVLRLPRSDEEYWSDQVLAMITSVENFVFASEPAPVDPPSLPAFPVDAVGVMENRARLPAAVVYAGDELSSARMGLSRSLSDLRGFVRLTLHARRLVYEAETRFVEAQEAAAASSAAAAQDLGLLGRGSSMPTGGAGDVAGGLAASLARSSTVGAAARGSAALRPEDSGVGGGERAGVLGTGGAAGEGLGDGEDGERGESDADAAGEGEAAAQE